MKKIYSFAKQATVAVAFCFGSFFSTQAFGQCGNIVENFNSTSGGFTGSLTYNSSGGYLQKAGAAGNSVYTETTATYKLANIENTIGIGFDLGGNVKIGSYSIVVNYVSTVSGQVVQGNFGTAIPNYNNGGSATICSAISTSTLPNFPVGGLYSFTIQFIPNTGAGLSTDIFTFDNFRTNGTLSQIALPVTFIGFEVNKVASGVQLSWKTAEQDNVNHYEVERSSDGRSFASIANIAVSKTNSYSYFDASAVATVYYRIKNVDNDGKFKYSNIARITNGISSIVMNAFPQPALSKLTVQHPTINGNALFTLSAADGRIINTIRPASGSMQTLVDVSKLQSGLYLLRFDDGAGNVETMKVIKQ